MKAPTCVDCGYVVPVHERRTTPSVWRQLARVFRGLCPACGSKPADVRSVPVQRRYWA